MDWSLSFSPMIDDRLLAGLAVAVAVVALVGLFRRTPGAWLRALAGGLLLLALAVPSLRQEDRETVPAVVTIVTDRSASQGFGEREGQTDAAVAGLRERIERLGGFEVREVAADSAGTDGTHLFGVLEQALADVPEGRVGGTVLVTDGQVHDIPADAAELGFNAPVHVLVTGHEQESDRRVVLNSTPRFGIVGEEKPITFHVEDVGPAAPEPGPGTRVEVQIRRDGELLRTMNVTPGDNVTVPVEIAHGGKNLIEIEAAPLEGELTDQNNRGVISVEGIRDTLRVLLVSGSPHAGERTWRNILKSDASVDLVHFTILRPPEKQDGTPISELSLIAFPTRELFSEKIDQFDLIIFDRYQSRGVLPILYYDNIARYVEDGGAVLVASGPEYAENVSLFRTPLASVLPAQPSGRVVEEPYRAALSIEGQRHPITRDLVPAGATVGDWSEWFRLVEANPAGETRTLMTGAEEMPLLVTARQGEGRIALMLSDHAWLWARGFEGGGPYVPLLRRLSHWLMKETDLEEEALRAYQEGDRLVIERQTMEESVPEATLTRPSDIEETLEMTQAEPGRWRVAVEAEQQGLYRVVQGDLRTVASVGPANPKEFAEVLSTQEKLSPLAEQTGGGVYRLAEDPGDTPSLPRILPVRAGNSASGSDWMGLRRSEDSILHGVHTLPVMSGILGLLLLLAALAGTWFREGR
ncbi:threonine dehydrogenase [Lutibaculum baratangense]|uniref:Threonine dehydrogenase n=1 Tax=Lutibaculum baratangense AMV1 TaxID=631454 RepID=V4RAF3_9HYPH|nr:threonine dehydrogenase [Lutibaculum baratangense]ESR23156.1 Threonine dehydrogenase [Lutibaculum baratangense AMV1]